MRKSLFRFAMTFVVGLFLASVSQAVLISEFEPNPEGTDPIPTLIEISGTPGASYSLTFLTIEAETNPGVIDSFVTASGTFSALGLATLSNPVDVENPAYTAMLVSGFTGALTQDLDTNNDGVLDLTPWTMIEDSIAIPDAGSIGSGDKFYSAVMTTVPPTTPVSYDDEPILVFRDASVGAWYAVHEINGTLTYQTFAANGTEVPNGSFNASPILSTYGAINPSLAAIPEPSTYALLGAAAVGLAFFRRRRVA